MDQSNSNSQATEPTTVCTVVFDRTGKRLLSVSRKSDPTQLGLPGGKVEPGESLEDAAIRETKEETGIVVKSLVPLFTGKSRTTVCRCFLVKLYDGEAIQPINEGRVNWVEPIQILHGPFRNYNAEVLLILNQMGYEIFPES